jgi:kynurenine--oxoglutarate transaminase/cysteine-S-conjugate beta-lyase/glutamine--phenylpyruvate transaminase
MSKISAFSALRLSKLDPKGTVFSEYTALANLHKSTNLGQGFPTLPVADFILSAADKAIKNNPMGHQYTRSEGHPRLVKALAKFYSPKLNRELDPMNEIMTTVGASEAIYSTIQALINPGDEVILMQPYYDSYPASVLLAGGTSIIVSLKSKGPRSSDWTLDMNTLESKITPKSKLIILNNPNNPLGIYY